MKSKPLLVAVFLALVVGAIYWANSRDDDPEPRELPHEKLTEVSLVSSKNLWCTLPIVAKEKGYFEDNGLSVSFEYVQAAKFAMDALVADSVDFATVVDVNVAYVGFTDNDDIRVVAKFVEAYDGAIVARASADISTVSDLRGKSLAVLKGTTSEFFAHRLLEKTGISPEELKIVNLQPVAIQTSVIEGAVDAGSIWQPLVSNIEAGLPEHTTFEDPLAYTGFMNLAVRNDYVTKNKENVEAFVRALKEAELFVKENPAESQKIMANTLNLDVELVASIWQKYLFEVDLNLDQVAQTVDVEGKWIQSTQPAFKDKPVPSYSKYFLSLAQKRQEAVTP